MDSLVQAMEKLSELSATGLVTPEEFQLYRGKLLAHHKARCSLAPVSSGPSSRRPAPGSPVPPRSPAAVTPDERLSLSRSSSGRLDCMAGFLDGVEPHDKPLPTTKTPPTIGSPVTAVMAGNTTAASLRAALPPLITRRSSSKALPDGHTSAAKVTPMDLSCVPCCGLETPVVGLTPRRSPANSQRGVPSTEASPTVLVKASPLTRPCIPERRNSTYGLPPHRSGIPSPTVFCLPSVPWHDFSSVPPVPAPFHSPAHGERSPLAQASPVAPSRVPSTRMMAVRSPVGTLPSTPTGGALTSRSNSSTGSLLSLCESTRAMGSCHGGAPPAEPRASDRAFVSLAECSVDATKLAQINTYPSALPVRPKVKVCLDFLQGICHEKRTRCRFLHPGENCPQLS